MFNRKCREKMCHVVYLIIKSNCFQWLFFTKIKGVKPKETEHLQNSLSASPAGNALFWTFHPPIFHHTSSFKHFWVCCCCCSLFLLVTIKKCIPFTIARASSCCSSESFFFLLLYSFYSSSCVAEECWREITVNKHRLTAAQCCEPGRVWCLISVMFSL